MATDFSRLFTVFEPTVPTNGPVLNWLMGPGFAGRAPVVYALSMKPPYRHPKSLAAGLPMDRIITWDPPRREQLPAFAEYLLEFAGWFRAQGDIVGGLSLTANYANSIYRHGRSSHFRRLGLTMISPPASPESLLRTVRTGAVIGSHAGWFIRGSLFRWTFIPPSERPRIKRELGRGALADMKLSFKSSSRWCQDTLADVMQLDGPGAPQDPNGEVFVVNVPRAAEDVLDLSRSLPAVRSAFPGCNELMVRGATRHGSLELDGPSYAIIFQAIRSRYLFNWGLV